MASYQELVNQAREKYGDAAVNEAIRSIEETSSGSKFSPQLEGINNRDYYSALSLLESDPNINQAVQAGYQARQQAKGAGMNVGQYQEYMAIREKQLGMPAPYGVTEISKGVIAPIQPVSQTDLSNMQKQGFNPVYDKGIITGFEDTQRGMSIPLANINQYIEQTNQPIQQPNNQQIQPKESFQEVITPKGEFAGLKKIQPQYPNMIREPTTYQKIQSYIQKKTGIYLPSFGEAKLGTQNLMQQTYQEVQPLSTQGLPYRTAVGLLKPFEKAEYIVQQGFKDMGTTEYNVPYNLPYQTRGTAYYNPETKTYLPYTQGDQFTKVSTPLGAVGEAVAFAPRVSAMAFFPEVYFGASAIKNVGEKNYLMAGLDVGFGFGGKIVKPIVQSKIFQKIIDPLKSELTITERIRKYPELKQMDIIDVPGGSITQGAKQKVIYDIKSLARPSTYSKQTSIELQTPVRKLFGLKPKTIYEGDPFLNKEAYKKAKSLLGDFGVEAKSAKDILRQTRPKLQEFRFNAIGKTIETGKGQFILVSGESKVIPGQIKGIRTKQFTPYGEVVGVPGKSLGEIKDVEYLKSFPTRTKVFYADNAKFQKLSQIGKTETREVAITRVKPTETIDIGKLQLTQEFPVVSSKFYKADTLSRELLPSGRLGKIQKSSSQVIVREGTPGIQVNLPEIKVSTIIEPVKKMSKKQANELIIKNLPEIKKTLRNIYGKPTRQQLAYETSQISQKKIEQITSQIPKSPKSILVPKQLTTKQISLVMKPSRDISKSIYAGKGTYERFASSENLFVSIKPTGIQVRDEFAQGRIPSLNTESPGVMEGKISNLGILSSARISSSDNSRIDNALKPVTEEKTKTIQEPGLDTGLIQNPIDRVIDITKPKEATGIRQQPTQRVEQRQGLKIIPRMNITPTQPTPQRPRPEIPIRPTKILPFAKSITSKLGKGIKLRRTGLLTVEFRRKGKFAEVAKVKDIGSALAIGKSKARQTLGASFRVRSDKGYLSFAPSEEFRLGSKGRDSTILVQRATSRLSSRPERLEIIRSRGRFL